MRSKNTLVGGHQRGMGKMRTWTPVVSGGVEGKVHSHKTLRSTGLGHQLEVSRMMLVFLVYAQNGV